MVVQDDAELDSSFVLMALSMLSLSQLQEQSVLGVGKWDI